MPSKMALCIANDKPPFRWEEYRRLVPWVGEQGPHQWMAEQEPWLIPRSYAEEDANFLQLVPYLVLVEGGRILSYSRGGASEEARLRAKRSVGVGGHIEPGDLKLQDGVDKGAKLDLRATIYEAMYRELAEETGFGSIRVTWQGLLHDSTTPVGRVHLGLLATASAISFQPLRPEPGVLIDPRWETPEELMEAYESLEPWSQMAVPFLMKRGL